MKTAITSLEKLDGQHALTLDLSEWQSLGIDPEQPVDLNVQGDSLVITQRSDHHEHNASC